MPPANLKWKTIFRATNVGSLLIPVFFSHGATLSSIIFWLIIYGLVAAWLGIQIILLRHENTVPVPMLGEPSTLRVFITTFSIMVLSVLGTLVTYDNSSKFVLHRFNLFLVDVGKPLFPAVATVSRAAPVGTSANAVFHAEVYFALFYCFSGIALIVQVWKAVVKEQQPMDPARKAALAKASERTRLMLRTYSHSNLWPDGPPLQLKPLSRLLVIGATLLLMAQVFYLGGTEFPQDCTSRCYVQFLHAENFLNSDSGSFFAAFMTAMMFWMASAGLISAIQKFLADTGKETVPPS